MAKKTTGKQWDGSASRFTDALKKLTGQESGSGESNMGEESGRSFADSFADTDLAPSEISEGDKVVLSYRYGDTNLQGQVKRIVTDGTDVTGINDDFKITGTEASPAAEVEIYYQGEPSGKVIGFKTSMLRKNFDDYSESGAVGGAFGTEEEEDLGEDEDLSEVTQTPFDFGEAAKLGRKLWRKQVLPFRKIKARGKTFSFTPKKADAVIASHESGAFDQVPFVLGHTSNPEMGRGELKGFIKTKSGLDALIETDARGTEMVESNPKLGTSVRILEDYTREADGKKFGPTIQHVAATFMPRMTGMSGWKPVNLGEDLRDRLALDFSEDDLDVLDLTGSGWEFVSQPTYARASPGGDSILDEDDERLIEELLSVDGLFDSEASEASEAEEGDEGGSGSEVDADEDTEETEEEGDELSASEREELQRLRADHDQMRTELRSKDVETYLDECMRAGVPKADIDAARPILLSEAADEEFEYVELSEEGAETKKATAAKQVRAMLESRKGTVEQGERGEDEARGEQEMSEDEKVRAHMAEHELSYEDAATALAMKGEIRA